MIANWKTNTRKRNVLQYKEIENINRNWKYQGEIQLERRRAK